MSGLAALLAKRRPAGLYVWDSATHREDIEHACEHVGWRAFVIDGRAATDRESFFDACDAAFALPEWFGRNWDALADCLGDLSWAPASGYVVVYDGWGMLARSDPESWRQAFDVLGDAVEAWRAADVPFAVLFRGPGPILPLPHLDAAHR